MGIAAARWWDTGNYWELADIRNFVDFQTAEVHHRETLTRSLSPSRWAWSAPLDVDPISVTVIVPEGSSSVYRQAGVSYNPGSDSIPLKCFIIALHRIWPTSALVQAPGWFE
ncbi:hypothetical protein GOP47_0019061 [Adiantum capillus-veneris]|uniref:Uncharacterized protein n=1 Tax=Adiantum capillus-veneris TaxID=13818 RepID=A0A9D4UEW0_ADICA|nr:hypothetical protein GOP47_0019061 [Adiantum capillus-veneris]